MSKFDTKKKLLVAEAEVYRQLLKMELQTLNIYTKRTKRRITSASGYMPLLMSSLPMLTGLFMRSKRKSSMNSLKRMMSLVMLGWQTYQRFGVFFRSSRYPAKQPDKTAAEEYLSKRL